MAEKKDSTGVVEELTSIQPFITKARSAIASEDLPATRTLSLEAGLKEAEARGRGKLLEQKSKQQMQEADVRLQKEEADSMEKTMEEARKQREARRPVFEPTKDNFEDFAAMFSIMSALTFAVGGKGRGAGMGAMAALNGALDGWNKGKKDVFEKKIKEYKTKLDEYKNYLDEQARDVKLALDLGGKRTAAGRAALKAVQMKDEGGAIAAYIEADNYGAVIKALQEPAKGLQQIAAIETKAANAAASKEGKLGATERKEKRGAETLLSEMKRLRDSFQPKFANQKFDSIGEMKAWVQDRFAKDPAMAQWWKQYENVAMPERHAMFGATLTGGEKDAWRRASIGSGDSTALIKDWFNERIRLLETKLEKFDSLNDSRSSPSRENDPLGIMQ